MKKFFVTLVLSLTAILITAQPPQSFKYQAVVRDNGEGIIANQPVSIRTSILHDSINGTEVYRETHSISTNQFGIVILEIGGGAVEAGVFENIKWGLTSHFLKLELDETGGTNYQFMGTSELLSVPYCINSGSLTLTSPNGTNYDVTIDDEGNLVFINEDCAPTISDIDGNVYNTVIIGGQCWMKENLKTTTYRNGTPIPNVTDNAAWSNLTSGAYVWYDNNISWKDSYGALYNWHATVDTNGLCPTGWHVPINDEWIALTDFIGGVDAPHGNELKSCRQINSPFGFGCNTTEHPRWIESSENGTDDYGFSGLSGGYRYYSGTFYIIGNFGYWWSSTENSSSKAWYRFLYYNYGNVLESSYDKRSGFSVRCLRD